MTSKKKKRIAKRKRILSFSPYSYVEDREHERYGVSEKEYRLVQEQNSRFCERGCHDT